MGIDLTDLYERDFYTWTQRQAEALRRAAEARVNTPDAIDWINLIDEVESMGSEQADKLGSAYRVTLHHLLKWRYQPDHRSSSWRLSIAEHRRRALRLIEKNPGLKPRRMILFTEAYDDARVLAAAETDLPIETFPETSPWPPERAMDGDFWPEEA